MPGPAIFRTAKTGGAYSRPPFERYAVAVASVGVATSVRWALNAVLDDHSLWLFFFPAVFLAAWHGRFAAGLLAIALAVLSAYVVWLEPWTLRTGASMVAFVLAALPVCWAAELSLRARRDLDLERKFLNTVLVGTSEQLSVLDSEWCYRFVAEHAAKLAGKSRGEMIGQSIWEIFPQLKDSIFQRELVRSRRERVPVHFEMYFAPEDLWFLFRARPINGSTVLYVADITSSKRVEEAQEKANQEKAMLENLVNERTVSLQESVAELDRSSYTISHNLRAPLRAMQAFADFLVEDYSEKLDTTGRDYLNRIKVSAHRMDRLIEDVLTLSGISQSEIHLGSVDLDRLVEEVAPEHTGSKTHLEISHPLGAVRANEAFLAQAVSNLLDNAVTLVRSGSPPQINIWSEQHDGNVRLMVRDQGIGVSSEADDSISRTFEGARQGYPGASTGLAIVKRAVERMGGKVGFRPEAGRGSTFWIELPKAQPGEGREEAFGDHGSKRPARQE